MRDATSPMCIRECKQSNCNNNKRVWSLKRCTEHRGAVFGGIRLVMSRVNQDLRIPTASVLAVCRSYIDHMSTRPFRWILLCLVYASLMMPWKTCGTLYEDIHMYKINEHDITPALYGDTVQFYRWKRDLFYSPTRKRSLYSILRTNR